MPVGIDYSSVGENAWRMAQSNASAIGGAIGAVEDVVKDRREKKDKIKVSKELAKALSTLYPESAGAVAPIIASLDDEELPLSQRAALGEQIGTLINMGVEKNRNEALMSLERSRLKLDTRRVDLAEDAFNREGQNAVAAAMSENDIKAQEALSRYTAIKDMEAPIIGQLPKMDKSEDLITKYLEEGDGTKALNAVEAYEAARIKQMEPLLGQPGKKLAQIGADGGTLDVFVSPSGAITDLQGNPLNPAAMGDGVLPPKPAEAAGVVPMEQPAERRVQPMPANLGFRPAAGALTPAQARKEELEIAKMEEEAAAAQKKAVADAAASSANIKKLTAVADKYTTIDPETKARVPKENLRDVTGPFAAVGKWVDKYADAESFAAKAELQRFVEVDLLEATKDLKPVSEDEMKLLMDRRPKIDSPAVAWAQYMDEVLSFIASKTPAAQEQSNATAEEKRAQNAINATNTLRGLKPPAR